MRSLVLIISLLFAFVSTQGQGAMFLRGSQPAPQPGAGILDSYLGAAFAAAPDVLIYSAHSVTDNTVGSQTEGQTGPYTVLVRRDNDDALRSFTYTEVSDGTLTTWVGPANNGFVQILYDQSTNGNHATQGTAANQPKIVDAGSLVVENGKAALDFDGVNDWLETQSIAFANPTTVFSTTKTPDSSDNTVGYYSIDFTVQGAYTTELGNYIIRGTSAFTSTIPQNTNNVITALYNGSNSLVRRNAAQIGTGDTGTISAGKLNICRFINNTYYGYNAQFLMVYLQDKTSDFLAIETAINTTYNNIY